MRTRILESGEVVTFEDPNEGRQIRVESHDEGQVTHAEPAEIAAPATPWRARWTNAVGQQSFWLATGAIADDAIVVQADLYSTDWSIYNCHIGFLAFDGTIDLFKTETEGGAAWLYRSAEKDGKIYCCVGGYALVGSPIGGACCFSRDGTVEWARFYQRTGGGYVDAGRSSQVVRTAVYVPAAFGGANGVHGLMKFSLDGTLLWCRQFGGSLDNWTTIQPGAETLDGGLACFFYGKLLRLDSAGNTLWCKKFSRAPLLAGYYSEGPLLGDDRIYYSLQNYNVGVTEGTIVGALSLAGELLWQKTFTASATVHTSAEDIGVIVAVAKNLTAQNEIQVVKYTADGVFEWARQVTFSASWDYPLAKVHAIPSQGAMHLRIMGYNAGIYKSFSMYLPLNGSGQGDYGDWTYENCAEPGADTGVWTISDDPGLVDTLTPYTLVEQSYTLTLTPVAQHFGEDA